MPYLLRAAVPASSAPVSLGFAVAAILGAAGGGRALALYAGVRSFALTIVCLAAFAAPRPWLVAAATAMILVQAWTALIGLAAKDRLKTLGPAATAAANLGALAWLLHS